MRRLIGIAITIALTASASAGYVGAQQSSNVLYAVPLETGLTLYGDFARGINDESNRSNYYGARIALGLPFVSLSAGGGVFDAERFDPSGETIRTPKEVTFGASAAIKLFRLPAVPLSISVQGGVRYSKIGDAPFELQAVSFPVAIGVFLDLPFLNLSPWAAPRIEIERRDISGFSTTDLGFGLSGGVELGLLSSLGAHAAFDWMTIDFGTGPATSSAPFRVGIGLHYTLAAGL